MTPYGLELLKSALLGLVEGITEWLPISSTGHMLLVDDLLHLAGSSAFRELFFIVIQLGAVLAVVFLFWHRLFPLGRSADGGWTLRRDVLRLWVRVAVACLPGMVVTVLCDSFAEAHLHIPTVIAGALIFYGVAFLWVERWNRGRTARICTSEEITNRTALAIGFFQVLSIIPGTSRSGATIIGALLLGVSRTAAAEFTFFLAVPVMLGMSLWKFLKIGFVCSASETGVLAVGMLVAFFVSLVSIRFLLDYVRRRDFRPFGLYRILLGILVLWSVYSKNA